MIYSHIHFDHIAGGKPFKDMGATFIAHTNAKGLASLKGFKRHALVKVTKAGYFGTSFRVT